MNSRRVRRRRLLAQLAAVGSLLAGVPLAAFALPEVVAQRAQPSSLSADYGPAVPLDAGLVAVPTGNGIEARYLGAADPPRLGLFRTPGPVARASRAGATLFLFAGSRGVIAVNVTGLADLRAVGSIDNLGRIERGAAAPAGGGIVAADDSVLHFIRWEAPSGFSLLRSVGFSDGRRISAIEAQGDSFLVASTRPTAPTRLIFTLYRIRAGAQAPDSLTEFAFNAHIALDLAWRGPLAFVADGNAGILIVNVPARVIVRSLPVLGNKSVSSLDVNDSVVVAAAAGRTFVQYRREGVSGDSLVPGPVRITEDEPVHARLSGGLAVVSTYDQTVPTPPEEVGRSRLEVIDLSGGVEPAPIGGTGRTRRVVTDDSLAYVADYTGGLRIYRKSPDDSSLVGALPPITTGRTFDVALDAVRGLVYLASGTDGLVIVNVRNPSTPSLLATVGLPGSASAVTVVRPDLVAVARRGSGAGVTFVDVADSTFPFPRGSVDEPLLLDPQALAARDTVLFVADDAIGVLSIGFGNPNLPSGPSAASGAAARDLDLDGTRLLVATRSRGLQIVDVLNPSSPILRGEFMTPPLLGVEGNGSSVALFLGEEGILVVDVSVPMTPVARGPIGVPGSSRDGAWDGDTLLVAAGLALERFLVSPAPTSVAALTAVLDEQSARPRAELSWAAVSLPGLVGLNVYRDLDPTVPGTTLPTGRLVNRELLPPTAVGTVDDSLVAGRVHRYRLEAFFTDGSARKIAEGTLAPAASARVGRAAPNPFTPRAGALASISYRLPAGATGLLRLDVHDVRGRLVRTIAAPIETSGGFGTVTWDGRGRAGRPLPSGIYFLHLTGAGLDDARTITLVR